MRCFWVSFRNNDGGEKARKSKKKQADLDAPAVETERKSNTVILRQNCRAE